MHAQTSSPEFVMLGEQELHSFKEHEGFSKSLSYTCALKACGSIEVAGEKLHNAIGTYCQEITPLYVILVMTHIPSFAFVVTSQGFRCVMVTEHCLCNWYREPLQVMCKHPMHHQLRVFVRPVG